jgi:hypothetical protein
VLHRVALPATLVIVAVAHWCWRWDFSHGIAELVAFARSHPPLTSYFEFVAALSTWTPPLISSEDIHAPSQTVWQQAQFRTRFSLFVISVFEHYLGYWSLLASSEAKSCTV